MSIIRYKLKRCLLLPLPDLMVQSVDLIYCHPKVSGIGRTMICVYMCMCDVCVCVRGESSLTLVRED